MLVMYMLVCFHPDDIACVLGSVTLTDWLLLNSVSQADQLQNRKSKHVQSCPVTLIRIVCACFTVLWLFHRTARNTKSVNFQNQNDFVLFLRAFMSSR